MRNKCILCLVVFLSLVCSAPAALVINMNEMWRNLKGTAEASSPATAWRANGFSDSSWSTNPAPFYYGEALSGTRLVDMDGGYSSVFLRKTFNITTPEQVTGMELRSLSDDGFIAWINGVEVARHNMPAGDVAFNGTASGPAEATVRVHTLPNPSTYLVAGQNTIAIHAFNASLSGSADFVIDAQLVAGIADSTAPTISSVTPAAGNVSTLEQITITFSEPVDDVEAQDLLINGTPALAVTRVNDSTFTFNFGQPAYGPVQITWASGHEIRDFALPANGFAGAGWNYTLVDTIAPVITAVLPASNSVVRTLRQIEVIFDGEMAGVDPSDLLINGVAATNIAGGSPSQFVFEFTQPAAGSVTVAFAAGHGVTDAAGNPFSGGNWSYTLNPTLPSDSFVLNEVQAENDVTLRDEDGEYHDWIEIHNRGDVAGSIGGWFLTDNANLPTQWQFPDVSIPANGYLIVFASGKDRRVVTNRLHSNFGLRREGEYVALLDPRTNVVSTFTYPTWPATGTNSYGRDRTDVNLLGFFTQPTPGAANQAGGPGNFAPEVVFSREQGTFVNPFNLTLSLATPDPSAVIRYVVVTNGTSAAQTNVPSATSLQYTGPISVDRTMQVRARAFSTGKLPGIPLSQSYIQITAAAAAFTSDLPLAIVHNFGVSQIPSSADQTAMVAFFEVDAQTGRSSLTNKPQVITRAGINRRGSSTQDYTKPSLAVEFWDEFNDDNDQELLGMPSESDWVLYAPNQFDHSLIHNPIGLQMARDIGQYASRTRMVETFIDVNGGPINLPNFTSSSDYTGIHVLEEKIKRDNNRVDIDRIEAENTTAPSVTGGWLLKIDRADADERTFTGANSTIVYQEPDGRDVQLPQWDPQEQYIVNYFNAFGNALNGTSWTNPVTGYRAYIEVDNWIDFHLVNVMTMNVDAFRLSGYFYKPRNGKIHMGPAWDFDRAMGTSAKGGDWRAFNPRAWRASNTLGGSDYGTDFFGASTPPPWWARLFSDPDFFQRYIDRYQELRRPGEMFDTNVFLPKIDRMHDEIREAQTRELLRWSAGGNSDTSPRQGLVNSPQNFYGYVYSYRFPTPGTFQGEIDFQKNWFAEHIHFMDTNFLDAPLLASSGGVLTGPVEFAMAAVSRIPGTQIYYTLDGTDPRLPGGALSPTAQLYTGPINITTNTHVFARARNTNHRNLTGTGQPPISSPWSGPSEAVYYSAIPPLRITEIMYHPLDAPVGNTNDQDNFEYLEVKNVGTAPLNLNRFRLRGGLDFVFGDHVLAAGASAVIVANSNAFVSRYGTTPRIVGVYTDDNLNNAGERLVLEGPRREPIHDFDYSDNWYPSTDGHGFSLVIRNDAAALDTWGLATSWRPSGALNGSPAQNDPAAPSLAQVVINEVLTHSDPPPPTDTIELRNLGATVANIGGWFLTDDFDRPKKYRIPAGTTINPNGYIIFNESHFNVGTGGNEAFSLSSHGEEVYLLSGNGTELTGYVHGFDFGAAPTGVPFGRHITSTGSEQFPAQATPTLGAANSPPRVGPVVVTEIMYHPADTIRHNAFRDNSLDEFIELQNITDETVLLYDPAHPTNTWRLRDAVDFEFPLSASIPVGGRVLVVSFDPADTAKVNGFRTRNNVAASVPLYGPFRGQLDNSTEAIELERPDNPEPAGPPDFGLVPYVLVERIRYADELPWPIAADGLGHSLQRLNASAYGNDAGNWVAAARTPGAAYGGGVAPVITAQPTNTTAIAYNSASLSVTATGGNLSYQWLFNGDHIRGATNAILTLTDVQPEQQGFYQVLVLNPSGAVASSNAFLRVLIPSRIIAQPVSLIFANGSTNDATYGETFTNATFAVSAISSSPLTYQWRRNGAPIAGATSHTLIINDVGLTDEGTYDVVVTDNIGSVVSAPAQLTVSVRPVITRQPQPIHALVGEDVTISVEHRGTSPFGYRWRRSGIQIQPFPGSRVYTIPNVQSNHAGNYSVIITNLSILSPGVLSSNAVLVVLADRDGDKAPDAWETQFGFNPDLASDGRLDSDSDGMINADEYRAGTDPTDPQSYLAVDTFSVGTPATLTFFAISNHSYMVEYNDELDPGTWSVLTVVPAPTTNGVQTVTDPAASPSRYYRLATPMRQE